MEFARITINPKKMGGAPCIRDLRMPVETILRMLESWMSNEEILDDFPYLEEEDIRESLLYSARMVRFRDVPLFPEMN